MKLAESNPERLQRHLNGTYQSLRLGIAVIGLGLPLVLWLGDWWWTGEGLRGSISAYYYSDVMRDKFVGALVGIGFLLYLYKGFSSAENIALNLAGVLIALVALVPTQPPAVQGSARALITPHLLFAVGFFLCIAYVCVFRAADTLSLMRDSDRAGMWRRTYRILGGAMLASPIVAILFHRLIGGGDIVTFLVEAFGVWAFAAYWLVKSREMQITSAELLAAEGKLAAAESAYERPDAAPGRLVVAPPDQRLLEGEVPEPVLMALK